MHAPLSGIGDTIHRFPASSAQLLSRKIHTLPVQFKKEGVKKKWENGKMGRKGKYSKKINGVKVTPYVYRIWYIV